VRLIYILAISGFFGKSKQELELLPPPPPFPDIEEETKKIRETEMRKEIELETKKQREIERIKLKAEKRMQRVLAIKKKEELKKKNKELLEEKRRKAKEIGHKPFLDKFFGKKEEKQIDKELREIERIVPKPAKKEKIEPLDIKSDIPDVKFDQDVEKPHEVLEAEKEIQRAIEGIKRVSKKKPFIKRLFGKKKSEEKTEFPEVIPRVEENADVIYLIEGKLHMVRLALMDFKFDDAQKIYIEIMKMYNDLDLEKKAKVYDDIKDLYYERKTAEKYAK